MTIYRKLFAQDTQNPVSLFRYFNQDKGKMVVFEQYGDLICPGCEKIDERRALERGLNLVDVPLRTSLNVFCSAEDFYIVSNELKIFLEKKVGSEIEFFVFTRNADFFVAMPKYKPESPNDAFEFGKPCKVCHRFRTVVFGPGKLEVENGLRLGAIQLEGWHGSRQVWFASEDFLKELKSSESLLKGFFADRHAF